MHQNAESLDGEPDVELRHVAVQQAHDGRVEAADHDRRALGPHRAPIELLKDALHSANSYYAFVLDAVVATLPRMTPEIEKRARDLAITGPPQEFVGLSGAVTIALEPFSSHGSDILQGARS